MENNEMVYAQDDIEANKGTGILMSVFPILFFLPLVADNMKGSAYLKYRANQNLLGLLISVASSILGGILGLIPALGFILSWVFSLAVLVVYIINLINAIQANGKKLPFIGTIEIIK